MSRWGSPQTEADLTAIFIRHLQGNPQTPSTPFSPDPISEETKTILPQLLKMNAKGWWTVGSQPAVDSADSTDPIFGWGPSGGQVFQKAFVEFFAEEESVEVLKVKVAEAGGWVSWFAANAEVGDLV